MNQLEVIERANKVLTKYRAFDGSIVRVSKIVDGIKFKSVEVSNKISLSGAISLQHKTIYVNKNDSSEEQLFVLGHELGHYFLDHLSNDNNNEIVDRKRDKTNKQESSDKEKEEEDADLFSGFLLMPVPLLTKILSMTNNDIDETARLMGVPVEVCKKQIEILKLFKVLG